MIHDCETIPFCAHDMVIISESHLSTTTKDEEEEEEEKENEELLQLYTQSLFHKYNTICDEP